MFNMRKYSQGLRNSNNEKCYINLPYYYIY